MPCGSGPLEGAASFGTSLGRKVPLGPLLQKHFTQLLQHVLRGRFSLPSSVSLRTVSAQCGGGGGAAEYLLSPPFLYQHLVHTVSFNRILVE